MNTFLFHRDFIFNVAVILSTMSLYIIVQHLMRHHSRWMAVMHGCIFGTIAIIVMIYPVNYAPGIFYDGRHVVLAMAAIFGGGIAGIIAASVALIYRAIIGGGGVWAGITTIILSTGAGYIYRIMYKERLANINILHIYLFGFIITIIMLLCQLLIMPWPSGLRIMRNIGLSVMIIYPISTVLIGYMLSFIMRFLKEKEYLKKANCFTDKILKTANIMFVQLDVNGNIVRINRSAEDISGYRESEVIGKNWFELLVPRDTYPEVWKLFNKIQDGDDTISHFENPIIDKSGNEHYINWQNSILRDGDAEVGTISFGIDITEKRALVEDLRESEERWRFALEGAGDGVWDWNAKTGHIYFSHQWKAMLGYSDEEVGNSYDDWHDKIHPDDIESTVKALNEHLEGRTDIYWNEHRLKCSDGSYKWILDRGKVVKRSISGSAEQMIGIHTDITELRKISAENNKLLNIVESTVNEIYIFDAETLQFQYCNASALKNTQYSINEMRHMTPLHLKHEMDEKQFQEIIEPLKTGKKNSINFSSVHTRKDGTTYPVEVHLQLSRECNRDIFFAIIIDITERRKHEKELEQWTKDLEIRIEQRTAQLKESNRSLEDFAYSVSHDLRTPLRAINGFSEIINERYTDKLDEQGKHYFNNIIEASRKMGELISDMLNYSRLGKENIVYEDMTVIDILNGIVNELIESNIIVKRSINIDENIPLVHANETLLRQIFVNIIDNAVKYRKNEETLSINIYACIEKDMVNIAVEDNGIGIDEQYHNKIFNIFQRLHTDSEYKGTGIGLAIVKKAAILLNGSIYVESAEGRGSTFHILLPIAHKED